MSPGYNSKPNFLKTEPNLHAQRSSLDFLNQSPLDSAHFNPTATMGNRQLSTEIHDTGNLNLAKKKLFRERLRTHKPGSELDAQKSALNMVLQETTQTTTENERLRHENLLYKMELDKLKNQNKVLLEKNSELENRLSQNDQKKSKLESQNRDLTNNVETYKNDCGVKDRENYFLRKEVKTMLEEKTKLAEKYNCKLLDTEKENQINIFDYNQRVADLKEQLRISKVSNSS
jgi:hypothetical protein